MRDQIGFRCIARPSIATSLPFIRLAAALEGSRLHFILEANSTFGAPLRRLFTTTPNAGCGNCARSGIHFHLAACRKIGRDRTRQFLRSFEIVRVRKKEIRHQGLDQD